jgi:predicted nucleic acid-binding protein
MHAHRVFIDSSFWIAFRNRHQTHHARASEIVQGLFQQRTEFLSTPFVFAEIHATFARSLPVREKIIADFWQNPLVHMAEVSLDDYHAAIMLLRKYNDKTYPFCDAVSFAVMQRLKIKRAAAFDHHFQQFGRFEILS